MNIDLGYGHVFRGTPVEVLAQMKAVAEGVEDLDLSEYIDWVIERAASMEGVLFLVGRGPLHVRAERLLREMIALRFARDLDAEDVDAAHDEEESRPTVRSLAAPQIAAL